MTTEEILTALAGERDRHAAAGRPDEVARVAQQISAHQALAALRAEQAALRAAGETAAADALDVLIRFWRRQVDIDIDRADTLSGEPGPEIRVPAGTTIGAPARRAGRGR